MLKKNSIIKALPLIIIGLSFYSYTSFASKSLPSSQKSYFNQTSESDEEETGVLIEPPPNGKIYRDTDTVYTFKVINNRSQNNFTFSATDDQGFIVDVSPLEATLDKGETIEVKVTVNPDSDAKIGSRNSVTLVTTYANGVYAYFTKVHGIIAAENEREEFDENDIIHGTLKSTGISVTKEGNVYVWGYRGSSQQGNGKKSVPSKTPPTKVNSLKNIEQVASGTYHLLALDNIGDVWGWGRSTHGETGCANKSSVPLPCRVLSNVAYITTGATFSLALDKDGQVWTWGDNLYGELGIGVKGRKYSVGIPQPVDLNGETARLIGSAYKGAFAVTKEGHVWAWGSNEASGLGFQGSDYGVKNIVPTPTHVSNLDEYADRIVYIAGGDGWGEALLNDGQVIGWGLHVSLGQGVTKTKISSPKPVVIMTGVKQLFSRYRGSAALTEQNEIYTWGRSNKSLQMIYGAVPTKHTTFDNVVEIGGGKAHLYYKTADGKLYGVGYNNVRKINSGLGAGKLVDWPGQEIELK